MTAIKEIALPRDDKQNRIYYSTRDANERVKNKKHGNYLQWSDFFVYAFFDKIIQFLSKPEDIYFLRRLERFIPIVHEPSINTG